MHTETTASGGEPGYAPAKDMSKVLRYRGHTDRSANQGDPETYHRPEMILQLCASGGSQSSRIY